MADDDTQYFYKAQDGIRGRDGGPYMDEYDQREAEKRRAVAEGREPDLDNPPPVVGTVLVPAHQVVDNLPSNPSMASAPGLPQAILEAKDDDDFLTSPVLEVPVDTGTEVDRDEEEEKEKRLSEFRQSDDNPDKTNYMSAQSASAKPRTSKRAAAKRTAARDNK